MLHPARSRKPEAHPEEANGDWSDGLGYPQQSPGARWDPGRDDHQQARLRRMAKPQLRSIRGEC